MLRSADGPPLSMARHLRRSKQLYKIQVVHSLTGHVAVLVNNRSLSVPRFLSGTDMVIHLAVVRVLCCWHISDYPRWLS